MPVGFTGPECLIPVGQGAVHEHKRSVPCPCGRTSIPVQSSEPSVPRSCVPPTGAHLIPVGQGIVCKRKRPVLEARHAAH